jgi:hypothetical protein
MAAVACTLRARIGPGSRSTILSGGDGHILVMGDLNEYCTLALGKQAF